VGRTAQLPDHHNPIKRLRTHLLIALPAGIHFKRSLKRLSSDQSLEMPFIRYIKPVTAHPKLVDSC
jgi:hypothetical protein